MSIFNTIGRLTYKTQRVVTNGVANPLREMSEGYAQARAKQNSIALKDIAEEVQDRVPSDTPKKEVQLELDL